MTNMKKLKSVVFAVVISVFGFYVSAQTSIDTKAAPPVDIMRSNGKIFVVMAVILIIMIGFFGYLINVDRKITKLEHNNNG